MSIKNNKFIISYKVPSARYVEEEVPEGFDKGEWVEGRLYYVTLPYYYKATAKVTTYSYAGNITFDYALPEGPHLSGYVSVLKPDPNPAKFANADVEVQLSLKGELANYTDTSNIKEWVFYAREAEKVLSDTQVSPSKTLSNSTGKPFVFKIPKEKIAGVPGNYQQKYALSVRVRFINPVVTKTGIIADLLMNLDTTIEVYKDKPSIDYPDVEKPTTPKGKPPVASIFAPPIVKAGDEVQANGSGSYDPDGKIIGYHFASDGANFVGYTPTGAQATLWYPSTRLGQQSIGLTVVDNDFMTDDAGTFVEVIEPLPEAGLEVAGTLKENRKVELRSTSTSPTHYPIVHSKTVITITAVSGSGGDNAAIKYSGSLNGGTVKDLLFKQAGLYKATISVENTLGYKDSSEITFEIAPDEPPHIYFSVPGRVYRDPLNGNKANIAIDDLSFSPDGDFIDQRSWEYRYDSDNDGSFTDESWVMFSSGNEHQLNLTLTEVGKYEIRHAAYESFGQPTISGFITAADRRFADSGSQPLDEKVVEVLNLAPDGDWAW